jgi:hypothetical protein
MNKLQIKKLGILSVAKMYGAIMLVMSLLISIPFGLMYMIFGGMMMGMGGRNGVAAGGGSMIMGLLFMILMPIFYGVIGFIAGAIGALLYNIFAGIVGGIEIEVENVH